MEATQSNKTDSAKIQRIEAALKKNDFLPKDETADFLQSISPKEKKIRLADERLPGCRSKYVPDDCLKDKALIKKKEVLCEKSSSTDISKSRLALAVISNPAVIAGIGSTIVAIPVARIASACSFTLTVLTAINTIKQIRGISNKEGSLNQTETTRSGVIGLFREIRESPALFALIQTITYAGTALSLFAQGDFFRACVFALFASGSAAIAKICSEGALRPKREPIPIENLFVLGMQRIPTGVRAVARNPGVSFPAANLALILHDTNFATLSRSWIGMGIFSAGLVLCTYAILHGLKPLVSKNKSRESGVSSKLSGLADIAIGSTSLISGFGYTAIATIAWGFSNILAGFKIETRNKSD